MNMDEAGLRNWLSSRDYAELVRAIVHAVSCHVATLNSGSINLYGYALLPGEPPYDIHRLVAVANGQSDIKVGLDNPQYKYHRYCVEEWAHWQHDGFEDVNALLATANSEFSVMLPKVDDDDDYYEYQVLHCDAFLEAIMQALQDAKNNGVFGTKDTFLVIWISDSNHYIISQSVRRLNSELVASEFLAEFGESEKPD